MLTQLINDCFASSNPLKERRLVCFAHKPNEYRLRVTPEVTHDLGIRPNLILRISQETETELEEIGVLAPKLDRELGIYDATGRLSELWTEPLEREQRYLAVLKNRIVNIERLIKLRANAERMTDVEKQELIGLEKEYGASIQFLDTYNGEWQERNKRYEQHINAVKQEQEARRLIQQIAVSSPSEAMKELKKNRSILERIYGRERIEALPPGELLENLRRDFHEAMEVALRHGEIDRGPKMEFPPSDAAEAAKGFKAIFKEKLGREPDGSYPAAFQYSNEIFIDPDNPHFLPKVPVITADGQEKSVYRLTAESEINCERTVLHELAHFELDRAKRGKNFQKKFIDQLREAGVWDSLKEKIDSIFMDRDDQAEELDDYWYLHEIVAIACGGMRHPYDPVPENTTLSHAENKKQIEDKAHWDIQQIVGAVRKDHRGLNAAFLDIELSLNEEETDNFIRQLKESVNERAEAKNMEQDRYKLLEEPQGPGARKYKVHTTSASAVEEDLKKDEAEEKNESGSAHDEEKDAIPEELLMNAGILERQIGKLRDYLSGAKPGPGIEAEHHNQGVKMTMSILDDHEQELQKFKNYVRDLQCWEKPVSQGGITPEKKEEYARQWSFTNAQEYKQMIGANESTILQRMPELDLESKGRRQEILNKIKSLYKPTLEDPIKKVNEFARTKSDITAGGDNKLGVVDWMRQYANNGVSWLCVYDIIKIFKIYKESILQAYHSQQNLVTNQIAKDSSWFLKYVPYGKPVQQIIHQQAKASNSKEVSEYQEYLEKEKVSYVKLFDKGGILDQTRSMNKNKFKGALLYAAKHAWLYKLDPFNGHNVYGFDYEGEFNREEFRDLVQQNESGKKKEAERGYERVDKTADAPPIIDMMLEEIKERNIFAAQGIMKRLQEKAKYSHSNTWMLVTLLLTMRDNKHLLETFSKDMMDNVCNFTINQAACSATWLKWSRNEIADWKDGISDFDNNPLTITICHIEKKLMDAGERFDTSNQQDTNRRNEMIAKVLSAKTVEAGEKKVKISIFQDDPIFNNYRKKYSENTGAIEPDIKNTDMDYFNPDNGSSDLLIVNKQVIRKIFERSSTGEETSMPKARNFYQMIFDKYTELKKEKMYHEMETYRQAMLEAFNFLGTKIGDNRLIQFVDDTSIKDERVIEKLLEYGMIGPEFMWKVYLVLFNRKGRSSKDKKLMKDYEGALIKVGEPWVSEIKKLKETPPSQLPSATPK